MKNKIDKEQFKKIYYNLFTVKKLLNFKTILSEIV